MIGWTILFALMTLPGAAATLTAQPAMTSLKLTSVVFALLFFISVMVQTVRGRVR